MTIETLKRRLELYLAAEEKILLGAQSYQIGDRTLTRADLGTIRKIIDDLSAQIDAMEMKKGRQKRAVFIS